MYAASSHYSPRAYSRLETAVCARAKFAAAGADLPKETNMPTLKQIGIKGRVYTGFGVLVAAVSGLAGYGYLSLNSVGEQTARMRALSGNNVRALQIGRDFEVIRRGTLRFQTSASAQALKDATDATGQAAALLKAAGQATLSNERRQT